MLIMKVVSGEYFPQFSDNPEISSENWIKLVFLQQFVMAWSVSPLQLVLQILKIKLLQESFLIKMSNLVIERNLTVGLSHFTM